MDKQITSKQKTSTSLKLGLVFCFGLVTQSCGFHLRESPQLPEQVSKIVLDCDYKKNWAFCATLRNRLAQAGTQVIAKETTRSHKLVDQHAFTLKASIKKNDTRGLTIRSDAEVAEYKLNIQAEYELRDSTKQLLVADKVSRTRLFSDQNKDFVTQARLKEETKEMLHRDLSGHIVRHISFVLEDYSSSDSSHSSTASHDSSSHDSPSHDSPSSHNSHNSQESQ